MSEDDKQAVADEADEQSNETVSEDAGAPEQEKSEDLETLLAEFKEGTEASQPEQTDTKTDQGVSRKEFDDLRHQLSEQSYRADLAQVISNVRGDLPEEQFDDAFMDAWVNARAKEDPRVASAWMQRHEKPKAFAKVVDGLGREFVKKYGKLSPKDEEATADREAVAQAVRGQQKQAPDDDGGAPAYAGVADNNQFRDDVEKRYGFTVPI